MIDRTFLESWDAKEPESSKRGGRTGKGVHKGRKSEWALQDAKARLSELIRAAEREPQVITYRGVPAAEVRSLKGSARNPKVKTLLEVLQACPKVPEFKLPPRKREKPRRIF